ncbi:hypothetical protein BAY1663_03567 [Pseudomonas sp. BAY1663]|nr:hypothetical protein BAY1663_03567 [Pseudomonas sp. BAY1663]
MHMPDLTKPFRRSRHELHHQTLLIRMLQVAADAGHLRPNSKTLAIQIDIAAPGAVLLDGVAGGALGLVTDEQDVMPGVVQHGLQVIDDAPTRAHAAARDNDGGPCGLGEVVDHGDRVGVAVDGVHEYVVPMRCTPMPSRRNYAGQPVHPRSAPRQGRCAVGTRPAAG